MQAIACANVSVEPYARLIVFMLSPNSKLHFCTKTIMIIHIFLIEVKGKQVYALAYLCLCVES
jgi:hypothetical protein